jgi:hypothetical protein
LTVDKKYVKILERCFVELSDNNNIEKSALYIVKKCYLEKKLRAGIISV